MGNKNRHHHQQQSHQTDSPRAQEAAGAAAGHPDTQSTTEPAVGPLEAALEATRMSKMPFAGWGGETDMRAQLEDGQLGEALEAVDAEFHGQGVFHTNAEMIKYLEDRGYQVIQPVQNLDKTDTIALLAGKVNVIADSETAITSTSTALSSKFDNLKFDDPDKFRVSRQVTNGNIMVMVELPETYAEGVLSEAKNQEITPGEFLDQRLQEAVENYFVSTPQTR